MKSFRQKLGWFFVVSMLVGLVFFLALQTILLVQLFPQSTTQFTTLKGNNIGVLSVEGGIYKIQDKLDRLERYRESDSIKGLLLDVNSPGGLVGPSQELSQAVERFAREKPVVASIRTVGASGAYYVASSADTIVGNPGSMVGSIGVIMQFVNVQDLINKVGVEYRVVKSGRYKDLGSPFRKMSDQEREILRELIMDVYDQFLDHILANRPQLSRAELETMANGRVFTGRQALENGLIDRTGSRHEAVELLGKAAGIEGEPRLATPAREGFSIGETAAEMLRPLRQYLGLHQRQFRLLYMMPQWGSTGD